MCTQKPDHIKQDFNNNNNRNQIVGCIATFFNAIILGNPILLPMPPAVLLLICAYVLHVLFNIHYAIGQLSIAILQS
jgi:hypothetical protein